MLLSRLNRLVPLDLGAINLMAGVRAAFACAVPVLVGELSGNNHLSWVAIAAFWGCLSDTGGAWSDRLAAMGAFTAIAAVGCFIATLVDPYAWQAVVFTFAWCFLCSLARIYGNASATVGLLLNSAVLVTLGVQAGGLDEALQLGGLTIVGGLWSMLLALVLWRLQPYGPARKAVGRCWLSVAEYAAALSQQLGAHAGGARWSSVASAALAATDPMSVYYSNTMESHQHDGSLHRVYFNKDHTFKITSAGKTIASGAFEYRPAGDIICLTQPARPGMCRAAHTNIKVGDTWPDKDPQGVTETQVLVAGRHSP